MKSLRALKAAGLIFAAVVLGLMTVQGSYALWNAAAPSNAGTIQAADFSILINGADMTTTPIDFAAGQLTRGGKPAVKYFEVTNNVNVTANSPLKLQASLTGLGAVNGFGGHLTVKAAAVTAGTNCDLVGAGSYSTAPKMPILAKSIPQGICLKAELSGTTPAEYLGRNFSMQPALVVAQLPV
ncbi:hypothetical protein QNO08_04795 [Arthrobacter sp. zg-Y820]|uniref:hypothetical protein n=1 Tax=unclassified Arthrobacter TaxID=235627 RepID=UPI001E5168F6|nr:MULTISPECIES: hypothetical protein [unclassified Arthrobacter]MCC9198030.1 hypothetical protein [Arthrobacter sp. zg-Y820]MDK1280897.1 hypothetical protein [Arthrobacter sp. zg.Y820]WIB10375.1 hypothetical protein QNO08_04795 [Arthrobacter sp. zg-Y820]